MKNYNPRERYCARCGKLIIVRTPSQYLFRTRDRCKKSPTYNHIIYFYGDACMTAHEEEYPVKRYRRVT